MKRFTIRTFWPTKYAQTHKEERPGMHLHLLCTGLESHGWKEECPGTAFWWFTKGKRAFYIFFKGSRIGHMYKP